MRRLVSHLVRSFVLARMRMASRDGPFKCTLPAFQNAGRRQVRTLASSKSAPHCRSRSYGFGKRANRDAAIAHHLFSPALDCLGGAEHFCWRIDGDAGAGRARWRVAVPDQRLAGGASDLSG